MKPPQSELQRRRKTLSIVSLFFSSVSLLLTLPAFYQGMILLRASKPLTHTTTMFRGTTIPCLACALIGLFLGRITWHAPFGRAAVVVAGVAIATILLIALPQ